jgi:GAF domain/ANTAR domain
VWGLVAERAGARGAPVSAGDACEVAAAVAGVDGAWLSVMSDPARRELVHATGRRAAELDDLQFMLGEGPCVDAFTSGSPVLVPDLGIAGWRARWPGFMIAGVQAGACAVFAFPLVMGAIRVGVLGLYRETAGSLSPGALSDVLVCADTALQLLLNSRAGADGDGDGSGWLHDGDGFGRLHDGDGSGWLHDGWPDDHAQVYQATGMVSAQRGVGLEEALALLRAYAFANERALSEVAAAVVGRRLRLDNDDAGEPAG